LLFAIKWRGRRQRAADWIRLKGVSAEAATDTESASHALATAYSSIARPRGGYGRSSQRQQDLDF
jgi:hypothetical protein